MVVCLMSVVTPVVSTWYSIRRNSNNSYLKVNDSSTTVFKERKALWNGATERAVDAPGVSKLLLVKI